MPSVTMAATPLFLAMAATLSPTTAVAEKPSDAAMMTSPGWAMTSAARIARLSLGARLAGQRRADEVRLLGIDGLDVMIERAAAQQGVDDVAGLRACELGDERAIGPLRTCGGW